VQHAGRTVVYIDWARQTNRPAPRACGSGAPDSIEPDLPVRRKTDRKIILLRSFRSLPTPQAKIARSTACIPQYQPPAMCTPVTSFPLIGDAACRQHTGGGPSHGHRQQAGKNWYRSRVWFPRYRRGQTDRHTDRHTHHNTSQPLPRAK